MLLAVNGATDYWYRATRGRSHPSLRNASVMVGNLLAQGANYTISVAAAVGDQERVEQLLRKDAGLARRLDSARVSPLSYAAREGHLHIVRLLLDRVPIRILRRTRLPTAWRCSGPVAAITWMSPSCCWSTAPIPTPGWTRVSAVSRLARCTTATRRNRYNNSCDGTGHTRRPYHMSVLQMKHAIREGHEVDPPRRVSRQCDTESATSELLDLYLDSDPTVPIASIAGSVHYLSEVARMVRKLLARGLDPNRPDWLGKTFLHACAENGDRSVAASLSGRRCRHQRPGPRVPRDALGRGRSLHTAMRTPKQPSGARRMVEFLLKRGAATNLPGDEPWATPLAWAARHGPRRDCELAEADGRRESVTATR